MGRMSTGAKITNSCRRIELSYLLKQEYIKKGSVIYGKLTWTDDSSMTIHSHYTKDKQYIRLQYTITDRFSGESEEMDYKVHITTVPSNLGKGEVPYLVCPVSGRRCRILYQAYGSNIYKCRKAYRNRIYYPTQISSKYDKYNDRYWELERQINKLKENARGQSTYNGKLTKRKKRLERLKAEQQRMDMLRWSPMAMPKSLRKELFDSNG